MQNQTTYFGNQESKNTISMSSFVAPAGGGVVAPLIA